MRPLPPAMGPARPARPPLLANISNRQKAMPARIQTLPALCIATTDYREYYIPYFPPKPCVESRQNWSITYSFRRWGCSRTFRYHLFIGRWQDDHPIDHILQNRISHSILPISISPKCNIRSRLKRLVRLRKMRNQWPTLALRIMKFWRSVVNIEVSRNKYRLIHRLKRKTGIGGFQ